MNYFVGSVEEHKFRYNLPFTKVQFIGTERLTRSTMRR